MRGWEQWCFRWAFQGTTSLRNHNAFCRRAAIKTADESIHTALRVGTWAILAVLRFSSNFFSICAKLAVASAHTNEKQTSAFSMFGERKFFLIHPFAKFNKLRHKCYFSLSPKPIMKLFSFLCVAKLSIKVEITFFGIDSNKWIRNQLSFGMRLDTQLHNNIKSFVTGKMWFSCLFVVVVLRGYFSGGEKEKIFLLSRLSVKHEKYFFSSPTSNMRMSW